MNVYLSLQVLGRKSQAHTLTVRTGGVTREILFSYDEPVAAWDGATAHHLTGIRRTSLMHVRTWAKDRPTSETGIGELQVLLNRILSPEADSPVKTASPPASALGLSPSEASPPPPPSL